MVAEPDNIWTKRNISWVFYEYMKKNASLEKYDVFLTWLDEIINLELTAEEEMLYETICWPIGSLLFNMAKANQQEPQKVYSLFEKIKGLPFPKPTAGYSFLFKAFHKVFKDTDHYLHFADWWNFENLRPEDFEKDKLENGRDIMSIAEQAYITYSKKLLPSYASGQWTFDREKVEAFLPALAKVEEGHPKLQYPAYFHAKLLLALGEKENVLDTILPFAKRKKNEFWVWQVLAEAFSEDKEIEFACYCRALSCGGAEEMLVKLRQNMAELLLEKGLFTEARTEIDLAVTARKAQDFPIPKKISDWLSSDWYSKAAERKSNTEFYKNYLSVAEELLYNDQAEELVFVEFVNTDKHIANFMADGNKVGFFKYERLIKKVEVGDVLKVRFQDGSKEGFNRALTVQKTENEEFKRLFVKEVSGAVRIPDGKPFGFIKDIYVEPSIISNLEVVNGMEITGKAIKSFNNKTDEWSWRFASE